MTVIITNAPAWLARYPAMTQWQLNTIVHTTANLPSGQVRGYREVVLSYENLPAGVVPEYRFQVGVATGELQRLNKIITRAPNPGATLPVWQYDISYDTSSFSSRSLLSAVKRCALDTNKDPNGSVEGSCTWKKEFASPLMTAVAFRTGARESAQYLLRIQPDIAEVKLREAFHGALHFPLGKLDSSRGSPNALT